MGPTQLAFGQAQIKKSAELRQAGKRTDHDLHDSYTYFSLRSGLLRRRTRGVSSTRLYVKRIHNCALCATFRSHGTLVTCDNLKCTCCLSFRVQSGSEHNI